MVCGQCTTKGKLGAVLSHMPMNTNFLNFFSEQLKLYRFVIIFPMVHSLLRTNSTYMNEEYDGTNLL